MVEKLENLPLFTSKENISCFWSWRSESVLEVVIQSEVTNLLVDKINEGIDFIMTDEILIYSNTLEEHYHLLHFVFQRLIEGGLKAN